MLAAIPLAACNSSVGERAEINNKTKFSQTEYQVAASPRITTSKKVKKGGGYYMVGKPYKIRNRWYKPKDDPNYSAVGVASWYGPNFHGRKTANGEIFNQYALSAAHTTMPLPSYARVTNLDNGSSVIVRVNDRGPFAHDRLIDLSSEAAKLLGYTKNGTAKVKVEYVGKAPLEGNDDKFLMASYRGSGMPAIAPGATQPGTLLAMAGGGSRDSFGLPTAKPDGGLFGGDSQAPAQTLFDQQAVAANTTADPQNTSGISQGGDIERRIELALAGDIPVPLQRPVTFEGVPFDVMSEQPFMTASIKPLGFAEESPDSARIRSAFAAIERAPGRRTADEETRQGRMTAGEGASEPVFIRLGRFEDGASAEYVRQRYGHLGMSSMRRVIEDGHPVWEVRLLAAGDVADQVLGTLIEGGLAQARIITR